MALLDAASETPQPSLGILSSTKGAPQFNGVMDFLRSPQAMALAQGLLQAGAPSRMPTGLGQGLAQGMANMQQATKDQQNYALNQQSLMANDLALKKSKADALADTLGSVHFAKPDQKAAAYKSALATAQKLGLDTSQWPSTYDAKIADPMVDTALTQSLGAKNLMSNQIEMMKAQAQLAMAGANLDVRRQGVNTQAITAGLPAPYPTSMGNYGAPTSPMTASAQSPVATATNPATSQMQPTNNNTAATAAGIQPTGLSFPAAIEGQKGQAKDWNDFKTSIDKAAGNYAMTNNIIDKAQNDLGGSILPTGPGVGYLRQYATQPGDSLAKESNFLQTQMVQQIANSGMGRLDIPIVKMIQGANVGNTHFTKTNQDILNQDRFGNEIAGNIMPNIVQRLDQMGVRDRNTATNVITQIVNRSGALLPNGNIDINALKKNWEPIFNSIVAGKPIDFNKGATANTTPNSSSQDTSQAQNYSGDQLNTFAKDAIQRGASPALVAARLKQFRGQ